MVDDLKSGAVHADGRSSGGSRSRLIVSPKRPTASVKLLAMLWRSDSVCARKAQLAANRASRIRCSSVLDLVLSLQRSKRDSSSLYTPLFR